MTIINQTIVAFRAMTSEEMEVECWEPTETTTVLILDNGTKLYASRDDEGNGPGAMFGVKPDGERIAI